MDVSANQPSIAIMYETMEDDNELVTSYPNNDAADNQETIEDVNKLLTINPNDAAADNQEITMEEYEDHIEKPVNVITERSSPSSNRRLKANNLIEMADETANENAQERSEEEFIIPRFRSTFEPTWGGSKPRNDRAKKRKFLSNINGISDNAVAAADVNTMKKKKKSGLVCDDCKESFQSEDALEYHRKSVLDELKSSGFDFDINECRVEEDDDHEAVLLEAMLRIDLNELYEEGELDDENDTDALSNGTHGIDDLNEDEEGGEEKENLD